MSPASLQSFPRSMTTEAYITRGGHRVAVRAIVSPRSMSEYSSSERSSIDFLGKSPVSVIATETEKRQASTISTESKKSLSSKLRSLVGPAESERGRQSKIDRQVGLANGSMFSCVASPNARR